MLVRETLIYGIKQPFDNQIVWFNREILIEHSGDENELIEVGDLYGNIFITHDDPLYNQLAQMDELGLISCIEMDVIDYENVRKFIYEYLKTIYPFIDQVILLPLT